jgi:ankyrin repeat protein
VTDARPVHDETNTDLLAAARAGSTSEVRTALQGGADPNARDDLGNTALHYATRRDRPAMISALLGAGADLDAQNGVGETPLLLAAMDQNGSHPATVKLLIEQRANLNLADIDGYAALHALVGMDDAVLLRRAIDLGADIEHSDHTGATPFLFAATYARANCMQVLVLTGATITARDSEERGAADLLVKWGTLMASTTAIGATAKVLKWAHVDTDGQADRPPLSGRQAPCGGQQPPA